MRSNAPWRGKTDDTPIPARVRLRVFNRYDGTCYLSGRKIRPGDKWEVEHIVALCNGGENREANLAPALSKPHRAKTAEDRRIKAKNDRTRKRHIGLRRPSRFACSKNSRFKKKISGEVVRR
jgi:5-methylcytosine-specific restriction enzyme A